MLPSTLALSVLFTALAEAPVDLTVPLRIQVPALLKALQYDRSLEAAELPLVIGVVFDPGSDRSLQARDALLSIHKELTRMTVGGQRVVLQPIPYASDKSLTLGESNVLLLAALDSDRVAALAPLCDQAKILTLSTEPQDVDQGIVVSMEMRNGKPGFVVNLSAASRRGASFESSFLALSRIVHP